MSNPFLSQTYNYCMSPLFCKVALRHNLRPKTNALVPHARIWGGGMRGTRHNQRAQFCIPRARRQINLLGELIRITGANCGGSKRFATFYDYVAQSVVIRREVNLRNFVKFWVDKQNLLV
jgi:hypothetical protein